MEVKLNSSGQKCVLHLFRNVENSGEIKKQLMTGKLDVTVIKASLIANDLHIFVAANKAALSEIRGKRLTRTIHTEVLYNLSPSKSVTESLKIFGIDDQDQDLIIVIFDDDENQSKFKSITDLIQGHPVDWTELTQITDWDNIAKIHGLSSTKNPEEISDLVISKAGVKDLIL
jgi:EKC/KEOPS complex subunit CGI121/TPRKB